MTGYGQAEKILEEGRILVEVQSLNRKHLEINFSLPHEWSHCEHDLRRIVQTMVRRGKVSVNITWEKATLPSQTIEVDYELAKQYLTAFQDLSEELGLEQEITLRDVLINRDVIKLSTTELNESNVQEILEETCQMAVSNAQEMRRNEGDFITKDIIKRIDRLLQFIHQIDKHAPVSFDRYQQKIIARAREVSETLVDADGKFYREVAALIEKMDISEEIVRFKSHLSQLSNYLDSSEPVGRLIDFVLQELTREVNTISSKSSDIEITKLTIEMKNEIERIREQIQNIE